MLEDPKLDNFLKEHNIKYTLYPHEAVYTVEEASKISRQIPGLHTKNLFLQDRKSGHFFLVSMNAYKRLNIKALEKHLGIKKLSFGSTEDLWQELKVKPGHCSIFSMIHAKTCKLILDREIWSTQITGFHPNRNNATLVLHHNDLEKYLKATEFDFTYIIDL